MKHKKYIDEYGQEREDWYDANGRLLRSTVKWPEPEVTPFGCAIAMLVVIAFIIFVIGQM